MQFELNFLGAIPNSILVSMIVPHYSSNAPANSIIKGPKTIKPIIINITLNKSPIIIPPIIPLTPLTNQ
jgi:hypothetical protein